MNFSVELMQFNYTPHLFASSRGPNSLKK